MQRVMGERLRATWQAHPWTLLRIGGTLLFLSLILAYNWSHTAGLLARYASAGFGPVAALGIEGLVAVMSFRLGLSRRAGRQERMTVAVLVSVLVVSAVANLLMGYEIAEQGNALTWETMQAVDIIQAVGWVMATALLSLVAYFAADTVANDVAGLVSAPQTAHDAIDDANDWRIVAEGPAEPVHEAVSVAHVVAPDAAHANGNGHHAQEDAPNVCKRCGQVYGKGNAGSHWTWDCTANPDRRKRKGA